MSADPLAGRLLVTYAEAGRVLGYGHSFLFEEVQRGRLVAVGTGKARRLTAESVRHLYDDMVAESARSRLGIANGPRPLQRAK